jgi:hypothetical protein
MLPLDVSVLKQPVLHGRVFSTEAYAASGRICSILKQPACAASKRVCPTAPWAASTYMCLFFCSTAYCAPLNVFVLAACSASWDVFAELLYGRLCCSWTCLVYSSLCCHWKCLFCSSLCCPWTCFFSPNPSPPSECAPPPGPMGGGHIRLRVRGWGSPNSDHWRKNLALCLLYSVVSTKPSHSYYPACSLMKFSYRSILLDSLFYL